MEAKKLIEQGVKFSLHVLTKDRLGRDLRDIINTIHFFTENKTSIHFISQSLSTLDSEGKENPIAKMMISILRVVGKMERTPRCTVLLCYIVLIRFISENTGGIYGIPVRSSLQ